MGNFSTEKSSTSALDFTFTFSAPRKQGCSRFNVPGPKRVETLNLEP
jgi:hypothetical protein